MRVVDCEETGRDISDVLNVISVMALTKEQKPKGARFNSNTNECILLIFCLRIVCYFEYLYILSVDSVYILLIL